MADAGKTREAVLLDSPGKNNLPSTVLRVGHHGSAFSTTAELLAAVNPLYAIISVGKPNVGKTNELGYPDTETLGRISKYFRKRFPEEISGPSIKSCSKTKQSCVWEDTALHPRVLATPTEGTITLGLSEDGSLCRA